ncbi:CotH kinase family protein [Archangium sp.]|uniref:CotH kinase family protein n=1 Tax=Archangium sp. TaxID=1872627 RepID=UPI00389B20B7
MPAAARIERPAADEWVVPEDVAFRTTGFRDAGGNAPARALFELWSVDGGVPERLVWSAAVSEPAKLDAVRLSDGVFQATSGRLGERKRYAVRVRYAYGPPSCETWGAWSALRFFRTDDASRALFDEGRILEFHLDIPPDSWAAMNAEAIPPDCVPYERGSHRATLRFGEQVFEGVGVHVKGGCGSARTLEGKPSFKVDLEWDDPEVPGCPPSRELLGRKNFTFNNNVQDPSFMNERLGYPLYRELGVPAPRAVSVRLYVNGEPWGLYTLVEAIDRRFLARWFEDKDGALYEGTYWCDLLPENVPAGGQDASGFCLSRKLEGDACGSGDSSTGGDPYAPLRELTRRLQRLPKGGFYPEVTAFFDYDRFLTTWALESVISHWDGYAFATVNNYRVYQDPSTGRWTLLSAGIDQTFGHREGSRSGLVDPWAVSGLLAARCLEEVDCAAAFVARLEQVTRTIEKAGLDSRVRSLRSQLASDVYADPRKETSGAGFDTAVEQTLQFIRERPARVRELLEQHR